MELLLCNASITCGYMFKPAVVIAVFGGACLLHLCLLFLTFHHRQKSLSSLRGPLGRSIFNIVYRIMHCFMNEFVCRYIVHCTLSLQSLTNNNYTLL